ncbi:MAG: hypothetical protein PWR01_1789 [Clostridiales bacterium]|jgi:hypothetical protein|nr:hypothetical protein [Clostridiales bacterium]
MDDIEILEKLDKGQIDFNEAFTRILQKASSL